MDPLLADANDPAAAALKAEWESLVDRAEEGVPWLRPGWITAWCRAFGRGRLELTPLRRGGQLVGLAPFERFRNMLIAPANYHTPEFVLLGEDAASSAELAARLFAARPRRLQAAFVAPRTAAHLEDAARRAGYRTLTRTIERSPYVDTSGEWETYVKTLERKMLSDLRRRRRRAEERGPLILSVEDGTSELDALLEEGFRVEAAAWKGKEGTAIASSTEVRTFYTEIARWAAARDSLRLAFLRLDGKALAFDLAIEEDGRHYLLKTGYDPAHRTLAPGVLLRFEMLARAFRLHLSSYEFLGADDPWKMAWTGTTRDRILVQAFKRSLAGTAEWSGFTYGRPLAKAALERVGR